jgi:hypothetical protein
MALVSAALDIRYITPSRHPSPAGPPPPNDSPQAKQKHLEAHLGAAPVPALGVIPDLVVGSQADPLGDLPVLASLLGQDLLDLESLVGRLHAAARYN